MGNFPVIHNGNTYFVSRSMVVMAYVFTTINKQLCLLITKNGKGVPMYNKWTLPNNYLEYDETTNESISRVVFEKTGIKISPESFVLYAVGSEIDNPRQDVFVIYSTYLSEYNNDLTTTTKNAGADEVADVKWVPISELKKYDWTSSKLRKEVGQVIDKMLR